MEEQRQEIEVIFFLGAGASVKAGVPDTFGFVNKFKESVADNPDQSKACEKILEILGKWKEEQGLLAPEVDVELLLETLERLDTKDTDILLKFHKISGYLLSGYALKEPLKNQLKDLIRYTGIVNTNNVKYLEPLLSFLKQDKPLDIFSVNYDIAIEQFCNVYKREYVDGFDLYWNPKNFDRTDVDIRLFKVHGSILWYKTDRGYYVKLPTKIEGSRTELITGEQAVSLMLYPMRKWDYDEPLLEMLLKMKAKLERAMFVVVVGYSFRDNHIRRIFWDAARTNKNMILILISPNAYEIYESKLKDYQIPELGHAYSSDFGQDILPREDYDAYLPSALAGRVLYLPYRFEDILPLLNEYLMQLKYCISTEKESKEKEYKGEDVRTNWSWVLRNYLNCEYVDKIDEIYKKIDWSKEDFGASLEAHFNIFLSFESLDEEYADYWSEKLDFYLEGISVEKLAIEVSSNIYRLFFKVSDNLSVPLQALTPSLVNILKFAKKKCKSPNEHVVKHLQRIVSKLERLYEHLMVLQNGFSLPDYVKILGATWPLQREATIEEIRNQILELERKKLESIYCGSKLGIH